MSALSWFFDKVTYFISKPSLDAVAILSLFWGVYIVNVKVCSGCVTDYIESNLTSDVTPGQVIKKRNQKASLWQLF